MTKHRPGLAIIASIAVFIIIIILLEIMSHQWAYVSKQGPKAVHNYNNGVRAERLLMYDKVKKSDTVQLTHGDNQQAMSANQQATMHNQPTPYKKSSDGNYWSWFNNHKSLPHGDGNTSLVASILGTDHPHRHIYYVDNQKILRKHGITTGVNFD